MSGLDIETLAGSVDDRGRWHFGQTACGSAVQTGRLHGSQIRNAWSGMDTHPYRHSCLGLGSASDP